MATKKSTKVDSLLVRGLMDAFHPLIAALDDQMDNFGVFKEQMAEADIGVEKASTRDNGIRFLLSGVLSNLYRQNFGVITVTKKGADGKEITNTYDNNRQRLLKSEIAWNKAKEEIAKTGTINEEDLKTQHWFYVNEARYNLHMDLMDAFQTVYMNIFNEPWEYTGKSTTKSEAKQVKLSPEELARILGETKKAADRSASRMNNPATETPNNGVRRV